jgi:hypothetical protein
VPPSRFVPCLSFIILTACNSGPESYPPPPQRSLASTRASTLGHYITMGDPSAESYFVRDISPGLEAGSWRWTFRRPELRFYLDTADHVKFQMDFSLPQATMKDTGPVTLSVFINGRLLGKFRYATEGIKHLERKVPPGYLKAKAVNYVAIEPDKVWISKEDGAALGFILSGAGFTE